jgi:hypothetical protein
VYECAGEGRPEGGNLNGQLMFQGVSITYKIVGTLYGFAQRWRLGLATRSNFPPPLDERAVPDHGAVRRVVHGVRRRSRTEHHVLEPWTSWIPTKQEEGLRGDLGVILACQSSPRGVQTSLRLNSNHMHIRLTRKLSQFLNGVDLTHRKVGDVFEVPTSAAHVLISEGWAELSAHQKAHDPRKDRMQSPVDRRK